MRALDELIEKASEKALNVRFLQNEPMKNHTTFQIGGPADLMAVPQDKESFLGLMDLVKDCPVPALVVGNGSNLLVSDDGIEGIVVKTEEALDKISLCGEHAVLAGAGATLSRLSSFCRDHALSGLEFAHGIPGTVGGAVCMNAGAYGGEMSDVVEKTEYYKGKTVLSLSGRDHCFSYRHSFFSDRGDLVVLSSAFLLKPAKKEDISAKIADLANRRREKQPLNLPSAGSVFKRPEGCFAGKLIEDAGLRGFSINGAEVSEKHAGFIVNRGGATCNDVLALIDLIQKTVYRKFSVELECEIKIVGRCSGSA